jgi:hypothetical protein
MGDGNTADQVVTAPAAKATLYGIDAAVSGAARALGQVLDAALDVATAHLGLEAQARATSQKWVVDARKLWTGIAGNDPGLQKVVIGDLRWFAGMASRLPGKKAIAGIVTYAAWTNSSTLIVVSKDLFVWGSEMARILLSHEGIHTTQFLKIGDRPPTTYLEMVQFEAEAYTDTVKEIQTLAASAAKFAPLVPPFQDLLDTMNRLSGLSPGIQTETQILAELKGYAYGGDPDPLLPDGSGPDPRDLYVP